MLNSGLFHTPPILQSISRYRPGQNSSNLRSFVSGGAVGRSPRQGGAREAAGRGAQQARLASMGETKRGRHDRVPEASNRAAEQAFLFQDRVWCMDVCHKPEVERGGVAFFGVHCGAARMIVEESGSLRTQIETYHRSRLTTSQCHKPSPKHPARHQRKHVFSLHI